MLGASKIGKIDTLTLDRFYAGMVNGGAGGSTVAKTSTMLHGLFGQAVRWGMMPTNPAVNSRPPAYHQPETKIPTIEDVHALLDAAGRSDRDFHALLWLAGAFVGRRFAAFHVITRSICPLPAAS